MGDHTARMRTTLARPTRRLLPLVAVGFMVAVALLASSPALATRTSGVSSFDTSLLTQLNQIRASYQLPDLVLSHQLSEAAEQHSRDMIANGYFAHTSPDGTPFWERIPLVYGPAHDGSWSVGENLFWSSGPVSVTDAVASSWMGKPEDIEPTS